MSEPTFRRLRVMPTWLISQVGMLSHRLLAERFAAVGARGYHYRLLVALAEGGPASQAELGRRSWIDRSDVVAALNELEADGYVARTPDPEDRRRNIIAITEAGHERMSQLDATLRQVQVDLVAPLTPAEREEFVRLLQIVRDAHTQEPG